MCAFSVIDRVPGVYIDEVMVPGVIAGVGTSTAAVVGPAKMGPMLTPTLVTNPTQFTDTFGGYITSPRRYATDAVHGFFKNGGTSCYFVRVGTAKHASLELDDRAAVAQKTLVVTARKEGLSGDDVTVEVQDANPPLATTKAAKGSAGLDGTGAQNNQAVVDDASPFAPGDRVRIEEGADNEEAVIQSIAGNTLTLTANLGDTYSDAGTVRIADLKPGRTSFRLESSTGIEPGSYLEITDGTDTEEVVVDAVDGTLHVVTLAAGITKTFEMGAGDPDVDVESLEFTLVVKHTSDPALADETFAQLAMDPRHSHYFGTLESQIVEVAAADDPPNPTPAPADRPKVAGPTNLAGGADDKPADLAGGDFKKGIDTLEKVDAVNLLCVPDDTSLDVQDHMIAHCQKLQDRFAILDPRRGVGPSNGIRDQRASLTSDRGYAALYYPRIAISDPVGEGWIQVPPSGHIAGVFARTDAQKGVHKAPANEAFSGVLDLERTLTDTEAGQLNELGVNVLRRIPNRGFRIWGARTIATGTQWRYVNVRRLLLFIEESIQEGTEAAVFEPNNPALWQAVKRQVTEFLTRVWRSGALFGNTPQEAFRVRVDEELNPPGEVALGKLTIEVLLRPTTPAEFIIFRIIQDPSRAIVEE